MTLLPLIIIIVNVVVLGILALILERLRARRVAEGKASFPPWVSIALSVYVALLLGFDVYDVINDGATGREIGKLVLHAIVFSCAYRFLRQKSVAAS